MKKLLLFCILTTTAMRGFAQAGNNLLNSTGDVGVGTTSPTYIPGYSVLSMDNTGNGSLINQRQNGNVLGQLWSDWAGTSLLANTGYALHFHTDGNEKMTILANGNTGIGNPFPAARLEVASSYAPGIATGVFHMSGGVAWGHVMTLATDNTAGADDARMLFSYRNKAKQWAIGGQNSLSRFSIWEDAGDGTFGAGFGTERLTVVPGGNVGIGTSNPDQRLTVNGTLHAKEVKVDLNVPGADYVFEKSYALRPLAEVKKYIQAYKHLPEVPSAKSMEQNGISVSEMNMKLLQKIEELTLYLIEKDKQLNMLTNDVNKLKQRQK